MGFLLGLLDATTQTFAWSVVFFLASAAASSAYLTVSEVFPLEMRAISISIFYAAGTGVGGFAAPSYVIGSAALDAAFRLPAVSYPWTEWEPLAGPQPGEGSQSKRGGA